jgi:hypothetical protein
VQSLAEEAVDAGSVGRMGAADVGGAGRSGRCTWRLELGGGKLGIKR